MFVHDVIKLLYLKIISPYLGKGKLFSDNSNLTKFVDVQRLHENGEWITCVSDGVYTV